MTPPLTAAQKRRAIEAARDGLLWVPHFFQHPEQRTFAIQALDEVLARLQVPLVFRALADDRFEIGRDGDTRTVRTPARMRGLWWAWAAIDDGGRTDTLRAVDMAAPDADEPEDSCRRAIRTTAAKWLEAQGFAELAAELRPITVEGGAIRYERAAGAPRIETR